MTFKELIEAVKDENLEQDMLEKYRDDITRVVADMQMLQAELQKKEALFMGGKKDGQSIVDRKVEWKVTPEGQRLIEIKNYLSTGKILMKGLQNRIYGKIM